MAEVGLILHVRAGAELTSTSSELSVAPAGPALITVAKTVAGDPTFTDRLDGSTAAASAVGATSVHLPTRHCSVRLNVPRSLLPASLISTVCAPFCDRMTSSRAVGKLQPLAMGTPSGPKSSMH